MVEVKEMLNDVKDLINTEELSAKLGKAIVTGSDLTWLDLTGEVLPVVVSAVENGKVELTSAQKSALASNIILPLIKDKLPWYIKPFAGSLVKWLISAAISTLNKLLSKDWNAQIQALFGAKQGQETGVEG